MAGIPGSGGLPGMGNDSWSGMGRCPGMEAAPMGVSTGKGGPACESGDQDEDEIKHGGNLALVWEPKPGKDQALCVALGFKGAR